MNAQYPEGELTGRIIGCAMKVHRALGNGFQELIFQRELKIEFNRQGLNFAREQKMSITYNGEENVTRRVDFCIENKVMVEIKAVTEILDVHLAQAINYLEASDMHIGLLINFGSRSLQFRSLFNKKYGVKSTPG